MPTPLSPEAQAMTEQRLVEIKGRTRHISPGPWYAKYSVHGDPAVCMDLSRPLFTTICSTSTAPEDYGRANNEFIAHARQDIPDLLREVERRLAPDTVAAEARKELLNYPLDGHESSPAGYELMLKNKAIHQAFHAFFARLGLSL